VSGHPPLVLQRYLRSVGAITDLLTTYAIKAKRHPAFPNLVLFKYDQIASPFAEPIVRECRGIILDESDDWRVVSRAFDKFFNHGEGHAAPIDWSTARVQEKLDGSLAVLYPYAGAWHVATSGTPDAGGDVSGFGITFRDLFWRTFKESGAALPATNTRLCFSFELTGPLNRVVVQHAAEGLTLLAVRDLYTQREWPLERLDAEAFAGIPRVRHHSLGSFDAIAETFATMNPLAQEGYVVVDGAFNRVKVKHPGYVALHHARGGLSRKAFVQIARSGESTEVIAAFPEFTPQLEAVRADMEALISEVEADYERLHAIPVQKDFALLAVKTRWPGALFAVRAKKADSVRAFARDCLINGLLDLLGYRGAEEPIAMEAA
jgi:RNA ligase